MYDKSRPYILTQNGPLPVYVRPHQANPVGPGKLTVPVPRATVQTPGVLRISHPAGPSGGTVTVPVPRVPVQSPGVSTHSVQTHPAAPSRMSPPQKQPIGTFFPTRPPKEVNKFPCTNCSMSFNDLKQMSSHILLKHTLPVSPPTRVPPVVTVSSPPVSPAPGSTHDPGDPGGPGPLERQLRIPVPFNTAAQSGQAAQLEVFR